MSFRIFVTHSERDRQVADYLAGQLVTQGFTPILAEDVLPGSFPQSLPEKVQDLIQKSDCVIAVITPEAVKSTWVHQEIGFALRKLPLIALVDPQVDIRLLGFLQGVQYIALKAERIADATKQLVDWTHRLKLRKENRRDLILVAAVGAAAALALYFALRGPRSSMPAPVTADGSTWGPSTRSSSLQ